jgi:hypothetical protein
LSEKKGDADAKTFEDGGIDGSRRTSGDEATENTSQNQMAELSFRGMGM